MVSSVDELRDDPDLVGRITNSLLKVELYEQAGDLYEKVGQPQKAMESYRRGQAYYRAVELARHHFPAGKLRLWYQKIIVIPYIPYSILFYHPPPPPKMTLHHTGLISVLGVECTITFSS